MANIAPDGTATGSITGSPTALLGTPSDTIDESESTNYGFVTYFAGTYVETVIVDLGALKNVSSIILKHEGEVGGFESAPDADYDWEVLTSSDGVSYTSYMSGTYSLTESGTTSFDVDEEQETSKQFRYAKVITEVVSTNHTADTAGYFIKELEIYEGSAFLDIGLRIGSKTIGAEVGGTSPLKIYVDGVVYGLPFDASGVVKIYDGSTVRGLTEI